MGELPYRGRRLWDEFGVLYFFFPEANFGKKEKSPNFVEDFSVSLLVSGGSRVGSFFSFLLGPFTEPQTAVNNDKSLLLYCC